jgi:hypothetical protein
MEPKMIKKIFLSLFLLLSLTLTPAMAQPKASKPVEYVTVSATEVVDRPAAYLGKYVKITAVFNKFSTLGLDYKPAYRNSKDYISFLVKRDNVSDHVVPLSELKIFITRNKAEKLVDLESGDKIEIKGKVFSNALGDAWMEAYEVKNLEQKPPKK